MAFTDIANNLTGAISNAASIFGFDSDLKYPAKLAGVTNVIDENDRSWKKSLGYSFLVVRVGGGSAAPGGGTLSGLTKAINLLTGGEKTGATFQGESWKEFILQINPQDIVQDEIFAIQVTPTYSGVFVEHQGTTLKDIRISGTTGLSPNRRGGGAYPQTGRPVSSGGRSGYAEFHELRNYIRTYVEAKRNDKEAATLGELRLLWTNFRDHEALYVEPQKFTMKRSASKPHLYDYDISLKAIGVADFNPKDGGLLGLIDGAIEGVTDLLASGAKLIEGTIDLIERVERDVRSTVLGPLREFENIMRAANNFQGRLGRTAIGSISRKQVIDLRQTIDRVSDNMNDFLGRDMTAYNQAKGRTPTLTQNLTRPLTDSEFQALNGLKTSRNALTAMLSSQKLFEKDQTEEVDTVNDLYAQGKNAKIVALQDIERSEKEAELATAQDQGDTAKVASLTQELQDLAEERAKLTSSGIGQKTVAIGNSTKRETIQGGDNIQIIAARSMGDPDRFKELVILNNLRYPYVDAAGDEGVLAPGDEILIPSDGASDTPSNIAPQIEYPINKNVSAFEKNLGVDLKLDDNLDIELSPIGDAELLIGSANLGQALTLKLQFEPGSLKRHPEIGAGLTVGVKSTSFQDNVTRVRASVLADPRVSSVIFVKAEQDNNVVRIDMVVSVDGLEQPIPLSVDI